MGAPKYDGSPIRLGGDTFVIPALSLRQVKALSPTLANLSLAANGVPSNDQMDVAISIIFAALSRNYPEMSEDWLFDQIDLRNVGDAMLAVIGQSGLVPSGEPVAANQASSTGTGSTST